MRQVLNFFIHLRLHYQLFILSGGFLTALLFNYDNKIDFSYWIDFVLIHVLLFGGATAYNSWWDKDEGPVGGLKNPPKMSQWMWPASLVLIAIGFVLIIPKGWLYQVFYATSALLFWLYSTPHARWKGHPWLSVAVIFFSTGTNGFWMGVLSTGTELHLAHLIAGFGIASILVSLYPVSQLFQKEEDAKRGDTTFAIRYGKKGIIAFFLTTFAVGILLVSYALYFYHPTFSVVFALVSLVPFMVVGWSIFQLEGKVEEYSRVMWLKYLTSLSFMAFVLMVWMIIY